MQLTESEWRTIHNALSVYQCQQTAGTASLRQRIQQLMDKIRDQQIAPARELREEASSVTEHKCPNCGTLISSGNHLCHACNLELNQWHNKQKQKPNDQTTPSNT